MYEVPYCSKGNKHRETAHDTRVTGTVYRFRLYRGFCLLWDRVAFWGIYGIIIYVMKKVYTVVLWLETSNYTRIYDLFTFFNHPSVSQVSDCIIRRVNSEYYDDTEVCEDVTFVSNFGMHKKEEQFPLDFDVNVYAYVRYLESLDNELNVKLFNARLYSTPLEGYNETS